MDEVPQEQLNPKSGNSRMIWASAAVIFIIIIAGLVYYFKFSKKYQNSPASSQPVSQQEMQTGNPTGSAIPKSIGKSNLAMTKVDMQKGDYLVDAKGMTLYIFDKDTVGKSNCSDACLVNWPIFEAPSQNPADLQNDFGVIKSTNGKYMYTYKNMPLYYYIKDKQPGDTTGDGVGGVWHLVKP